MVRVKICGLTQLEDAELAAKAGAWALGFIFYPKSPRYVAPEVVRTILAALEKQGLRPARCVGVFVNATAEQIREVQRESGIDTIQLHGDEGVSLQQELQDLRLWKVFRLKSPEQLAEIAQYEAGVEAFLFDAAVAGAYGGTGQQADWSLLAQVKTQKPVIVSGGLHPDNARAAWEQLQPYALDLASGVEIEAGRKDPNKIQALFQSLGGLS